MNCQDVQTQLSDFIENALDAARMKNIEAHLLSCTICRHEADGLLDCVQQISRLPMLDPPVGFTQRVMAHVREIDIRPSPWQRLLGILQVTRPLQASAAVLVAVLAVFLYQQQRQIKNNANAPADSLFSTAEQANSSGVPNKASAQPSQSAAKQGQQEKNQTGRPPITQARRKSAPNLPSLGDPTAGAPQVSASGESQSPEAQINAIAPRRPPIQAQEVATGRENFRPGDPFGIGTTTFGASLRPEFFTPERSPSPLTEPNADVEFIVRRRAIQSSDSQGHRGEEREPAAARNAKPTNPPAASSQANAISEVRWFAVPAEHYDQFRKELLAEAAIESEKTPRPAERDFALKSNRELLIKVMILSPAER